MDERDSDSGMEVAEPLPARREYERSRLRRDAFNFPALAEDQHFDKTSFPAAIKANGVRFNNHGDIEVVFVIPARYRSQIIPLGYAMRTPLLVHIENYRNLDAERESG